jgi:hypothetical protein
LQQYCVLINALAQTLPVSEHVTPDLGAISGLDGRFGPAFGLINTRLG